MAAWPSSRTLAAATAMTQALEAAAAELNARLPHAASSPAQISGRSTD
jgi:hypothetical protein